MFDQFQFQFRQKTEPKMNLGRRECWKGKQAGTIAQFGTQGGPREAGLATISTFEEKIQTITTKQFLVITPDRI